MNIVTKKERFIPLWYDLMFKKVFGDEKDIKPLKYLLELILEIKPKKIRVLNNEILGEQYSSKKTTVDVIVELEGGMKIGIEMNRTMTQEIIDRNLVYMFRIMANDLKHGESYDLLDKHIQINFDMEGEHSEAIESYKIISTKHPKNILTDKIEIIRIDVPYFVKRCYNQGNKELSTKEKIIGLIGLEEEEKVLNIIDKDDIMEEIVKKMRGFSKEDVIAASYDRDFHVQECARLAAKRDLEKYKREYEATVKEYIEEKEMEFEKKIKELEEKNTQIQKQILEEGIEQGIEQGLLQTARNMLERNCEINFISEVTGLTLEEINKIQ